MSTKTLERPKIAVMLPRMYNVVFLNDDKTPMQLVEEILKTIYGHDPEVSYKLMMTIHQVGKAVVGRFPKEIAEMKVGDTHTIARGWGVPLTAVVEPD